MYLNLFNFTMKLRTKVGSAGDDQSVLQSSQTFLFIFLDLIKQIRKINDNTISCKTTALAYPQRHSVTLSQTEEWTCNGN